MMRDGPGMEFNTQVNAMPGPDGHGGKASRPFRRRAALRAAEAADAPIDAPRAAASVDEPPKAAAPGRSAAAPASHEPGRAPLPASMAPQRIDPLALHWNSLPAVTPGLRGRILGDVPLVSVHRDHPASRAFDLLRTRLLHTLKANGWHRIAIAGPTPGCGATFTAVNLALSLARVPRSRTVLMDLNLRDPGVADAMELEAPGPMRAFLRGEVEMADHMLRVGDTLALGLTPGPDVDAAEILHDRKTAEVLDLTAARLSPDVVLYDLPPVLAHDDLTAFLPQVDGVLLVADGTRTLARHIEQCERVFDGQTRVLGVILNRGREPGGRGWDA